jgi:hypothetical protein
MKSEKLNFPDDWIHKTDTSITDPIDSIPATDKSARTDAKRLPDNKASVLRHGAAKTIPPTTVDDTTEKPEANEAKRPTDNDPRPATDSGTDSLPPLYTYIPASREKTETSDSSNGRNRATRVDRRVRRQI